MQPFRLSNLVVLAALVCTGAAIKCYVGPENTNDSVNCPGSCSRGTLTKDGEKLTVLGCYPTRQEEDCGEVTMAGVQMEGCFCNSDLCNTSPPTSLPSLLLLIPLLFSFAMPHVF